MHLDPCGVITLMSDFGLSDHFVGVMKGVILGINPQVEIVDITHAVPPQDVHGAAFLVDSTCRYFPTGTIHVVVVDPRSRKSTTSDYMSNRHGVFRLS